MYQNLFYVYVFICVYMRERALMNGLDCRAHLDWKNDNHGRFRVLKGLPVTYLGAKNWKQPIKRGTILSASK